MSDSGGRTSSLSGEDAERCWSITSTTFAPFVQRRSSGDWLPKSISHCVSTTDKAPGDRRKNCTFLPLLPWPLWDWANHPWKRGQPEVPPRSSQYWNHVWWLRSALKWLNISAWRGWGETWFHECSGSRWIRRFPGVHSAWPLLISFSLGCSVTFHPPH